MAVQSGRRRVRTSSVSCAASRRVGWAGAPASSQKPCTLGSYATPLKGVLKDYLLICDSYYEALRGSSPSQIESVDMGRRGLHNEGAEALKSRLEGKIVVDHETARRLFTLLCALYRRG